MKPTLSTLILSIYSALFLVQGCIQVTHQIPNKSDSENCALLGCYAASSGNSLPTFRDNLSVPYIFFLFGLLTLEDGTDRLFRNVGKELPLLAT